MPTATIATWQHGNMARRCLGSWATWPGVLGNMATWPTWPGVLGSYCTARLRELLLLLPLLLSALPSSSSSSSLLLPDHREAGHLRGQSCEDVSGESGLTTSAQGISEPRFARMSQAKVAGPPWGRAFLRSELRGWLMRKWPDHQGAGHFGTLSCEDVSGESGLTTSAQGVSEVRVARMSQARVA